ncbi:triose-phosphate transporter family-domain-containing protein [Fomitopsis serialis]|uniref:triose-phosphate transporter family-domain-containing protein n=1 Tax=Fomitopsis serialis TaxID=139415 RepID=UPI0020088F84|nr:triose-phosphate transporter family-domain-containing protein [Neoantrodia serialis]KAH9933366.1 triose-phosphate transporter family-domain-containing protein [Neoantrodia serialis]
MDRQRHSAWAPPPQRPTGTPGWKTFDSYEKPHTARTASWLASLTPGSARVSFASGKHPWESLDSLHGNTSIRLRNFKRTVLRRFSSWTQNGLSRPGSLRSNSSSIAPAVSPTLIPSVSTVQFVLLCALWYATSALSSNTGKVIMTEFRYPITLTFVQFGFVAGYCLLFMSPAVRFSNFRSPTRAIFDSTVPMGLFQVGGHIFSSMAISRIPVSTVHTIKALSPLFTVAAYALLFGVRYSAKTYVSLLPLTIGVILACSSDMSLSNAMGLLCSFGSALIFVSSNIFFKKVMPSNSTVSSHKLDKLNLLFYSSGMAFVLMIPIWMYYDLPALLTLFNDPSHVAHPSHGHGHHSVAFAFFANGTVHFAQNIIAFVLLAQTSPVTYSIASLIKRVAVICIAIVWFAQPVHALQAGGIALTFAGLYMYNQAKATSNRASVPCAASPPRAISSSPAPARSSSPPRPRRPRRRGQHPVGITSGFGRPRVAPTASARRSRPTTRPRTSASASADVRQPAPALAPHQPVPSYSQTHQTPNLRIKVTPAPTDEKPGVQGSPYELYPSPPPSLDSPPRARTTPRRGRSPRRNRTAPAPADAAQRLDGDRPRPPAAPRARARAEGDRRRMTDQHDLGPRERASLRGSFRQSHTYLYVDPWTAHIDFT